MLLIVCSVFDIKASAYLQPFFVQNENVARRSFGDAVMNPETGISKHASDYKLYRIATFDDVSGEIVSNKPEFLANATDFIEVKKEVKL